MNIKLHLWLLHLILLTGCIPDLDIETPKPNTSLPEYDPQGLPKYVKLDSQGYPLADQDHNWNDDGSEETYQKWSCVWDTETGLIWEVKNIDGGLHNFGDFYSNNTALNFPKNWDPVLDGNYSSKECYLGINFDQICTTNAFVNAVNEEKLCGASDWRVPTANRNAERVIENLELYTLLKCQSKSYKMNLPFLADVTCDSYTYPIDRHFFPKTTIGAFWSSSPEYGSHSSAVNIRFNRGSGTPFLGLKSNGIYVRVVRSAY